MAVQDNGGMRVFIRGVYFPIPPLQLLDSTPEPERKHSDHFSMSKSIYEEDPPSKPTVSDIEL